MAGTTLAAVVRVVDLPVATTITGAELFEVVQTSAGVGQSVQVSLTNAIASIGSLPTGGGTSQILNKSSGANFSTAWSDVTSFISVNTASALVTSGTGTALVIGVPAGGITSTQIANNAVGTNQIASSLGVASSLSVGTFLTVGGTATVTGTTILNGGLQVTGTSLLTGAFGVVGTSLMTGAFNVVGTSSFTGVYNVNGTAQFTAGLFGVNATTQFTGTFSVNGTTLHTGIFGVVGTSTLTGAFGVVGTATFTSGTFNVIGTTNITGFVSVVGSASFTGGTFGVTATANITGIFNVVGTATFTGVHNVIGTTLFTSGAFGVVGTALFTSNAFGVVGTAIVTGILVLGNLTAGYLISNATGVVSMTTAAPASNFVLLNTLTPNNVASATDTTSLTNTYANYMVMFDNVCCSTANAGLQMLVATTGTAWITTSYISMAQVNVSSIVITDTTTNVVLLSGTRATAVLQTSNLYGANGFIKLMNPANAATNQKFITGLTTYLASGGGNLTTTLAGANIFGYAFNIPALTGVNFQFSSGNISTGIIKIYGMT